MKIYTTYFAALRKLPSDICVISIAQKQPTASFMSYKRLAPPWYILKDYKADNDENKYVERYNELVLNNLDPHKVYEDLKRYSQGRDVALVCYERPEKFCHRHLVAKWLTDAGHFVEEWTIKNV